MHDGMPAIFGTAHNSRATALHLVHHYFCQPTIGSICTGPCCAPPLYMHQGPTLPLVKATLAEANESAEF